MIRMFLRAGAVAAVCGAFAFSAQAQTAKPLKPLSDADNAEGQALTDEYIVPLIEGNKAALKLAATDPAGACNLAKVNEERTVAFDTRFKAMRVRLDAEGKTTEGFDDAIAGIGQMVDGAHSMRSALCSSFLPKTGDKEHDEVAGTVLRLSTRLSLEMMAAAEAQMADDTTAGCAHLREARAAYTDLYAYIRHLRSMIKDGTPEGLKADTNIAKAETIRTELEEELKACPAV